MDKSQALNEFWNSFGIPAYDQYTVPDNTPIHYITYENAEDNIGNDVPMTASVWYRESRWDNISRKVEEIASKIGYSYYIKAIDGGYMVIKRGSVFAQRMNDPDDDGVRRILVSIIVEYLTED